MTYDATHLTVAVGCNVTTANLPLPPLEDTDGAAQLFHAIIQCLNQVYYGYSQEHRLRFLQKLLKDISQVTRHYPMVQDVPRTTTFTTFGKR